MDNMHTKVFFLNKKHMKVKVFLIKALKKNNL